MKYKYGTECAEYILKQLPKLNHTIDFLIEATLNPKRYQPNSITSINVIDHAKLYKGNWPLKNISAISDSGVKIQKRIV